MSSTGAIDWLIEPADTRSLRTRRKVKNVVPGFKAVAGRLGRILAVGMMAAGLLAIAPTPASAATFNWAASCGSGDYYDTGSIGASARVLNQSSQCEVKARVLCQNTSGTLTWFQASSWKGLGEVSTKYCPSSYVTRANIGVTIGG